MARFPASAAIEELTFVNSSDATRCLNKHGFPRRACDGGSLRGLAAFSNRGGTITDAGLGTSNREVSPSELGKASGLLKHDSVHPRLSWGSA